MSAHVVSVPTADDCELPLELEPALEVEPDEPVALEPDAAPLSTVSQALVEVLPADFQLPLLTRFIPNTSLRTAVEEAAAHALTITVSGPDGLREADAAVSLVRARVKAIDEHFADPTRIANDLHKRLTGIRGEWQAEGKAAIDTVGRRIFTEQRRLESIAAEERRKQQEEADRQVREAARAAAEAAKASAPPEVVEQLVRQAETITAPPVAAPAPSALKGSTVVTTWKARLVGTTGADDPNPDIDEMTAAQRHQVLTLLKAIVDGKAPLNAIALNWSFLNARAKSDKSELQMPGVEAFEQGSVRAKATRTRN